VLPGKWDSNLCNGCWGAEQAGGVMKMEEEQKIGRADRLPYYTFISSRFFI
jgi:hypothetical protein